MAELPKTRKEAILLGSTRYFNGKPCKHGHISERRSPSGICVECSNKWDRDNYSLIKDKILEKRKIKNSTIEEKAKRKIYRECNKQRSSEYNKKRYQDNIEYERERSKLKYIKNKECILLRGAKWREENIEHHREQCREWVKNNPEKALINVNNRRARKLQAIPLWSNALEINKIYTQAKELEKNDGIKRHVDHIIPLKHDFVCGLHVHDNMRIITAHENMKKGNHYVIY